jgi:hypothetical protein
MRKISRRDFVQSSTLVLGGTGLSAAADTDTLTPKKLRNMFVHHVYFWAKNPGNAEERARLLKGLQTLTGIEVVKMSHIGVPATTNRSVIDTSYAFSLLLIFDNLQHQEAYQVHPIHVKFVEDCASLWEKVIVYDSVDAQP